MPQCREQRQVHIPHKSAPRMRTREKKKPETPTGRAIARNPVPHALRILSSYLCAGHKGTDLHRALAVAVKALHSLCVSHAWSSRVPRRF